MKKGFTLIEILVAVTIVAILSVVGIVSYGPANKRARDSRRRTDMEAFRSALELYRADKGYYPSVGGAGLTSAGNLSTDLVGLGGTGSVSYAPALPTPPQTSEDYYYKATNPNGVYYYGYCLCTKLESQASSSNTCTTGQVDPVPNYCNYLLRNP